MTTSEEMLLVLKELVRWDEGDDIAWPDEEKFYAAMMEHARAAIAKAEGR